MSVQEMDLVIAVIKLVAAVIGAGVPLAGLWAARRRRRRGEAAERADRHG